MLQDVGEVQPLADVVRKLLSECTLSEDGYELVGATANGTSLVVYFWYRDARPVHAVELDAAPPLSGPSTGEPCATAEEWATEVRWLLDEEVGTRDLERRPSVITDDGVLHIRLPPFGPSGGEAGLPGG
jgi:hypothetical protein